MVITTRVYAEHEDLALSHTIRSVSEATIGVVSEAGTDPQHDVYYFWIETPDFEAVERALSADHTVADYEVIVESDGRRTYRVEYSDRVKLLTPRVTDLGGLTLGTVSRSRGWELELELPDHEALYGLNEFARGEGIHLDVLELQQAGERDPDDDDRFDFGLTESQREALVGAFLQGYYDEPRRASLEELADLLDITPSAVSGRLRRGSAKLVESVLIEDERRERD